MTRVALFPRQRRSLQDNRFMYLGRSFNYSSKTLSLATKVVVNQIAFAPLFNSYFFGMQAFLSGDSFAEAWERIKRTVPVSLVNSCKLWPAVTAFNFTYIHPQYRALFAGQSAARWFFPYYKCSLSVRFNSYRVAVLLVLAQPACCGRGESREMCGKAIQRRPSGYNRSQSMIAHEGSIYGDQMYGDVSSIGYSLVVVYLQLGGQKHLACFNIKRFLNEDIIYRRRDFAREGMNANRFQLGTISAWNTAEVANIQSAKLVSILTAWESPCSFVRRNIERKDGIRIRRS